MEGLLSHRYKLGAALGYGGMSEVREATDTVLQREVAIKILRPDLARDPSFLERFQNEARHSANLNHPNIVAVHDAVTTETEEDGTISYIVMELIQGQTLRDMMRDHTSLYPQRAVHIMSDVCSALSYSHRRGIVHRDIKPGNIMITPTGSVKVMDFGIALLMSQPPVHTQTSEVMGTAQYLSPEQARGLSVDARSDIYSTGCVLYEALTGQPPFEGDSALAVAFQHVQEPVRPPSMLNPMVSQELDSVVLKALAKRPEDRYQTSEEMESDLVAVLHGQRPTSLASDGATRVQPLLTPEMEYHFSQQKAQQDVASTMGSSGGIASMMAAAATSSSPGLPTPQQASTEGASSDESSDTAGDSTVSTDDDGSAADDAATSAEDSAQSAPASAAASAVASAAASTRGEAPTSRASADPARQHTPLPQPNNPAPTPPPAVAASGNAETQKSGFTARIRKLFIALAVLVGLALAGIVLTEAITGTSIFASQVSVADVTNMKAEPAAQRLRQQGFRVTLMAEASNTVPRGLVVRTNPPASTFVARGARIVLLISSGKGPIKVPTVRGLAPDEAREQLSLAGLKVATNIRTIPSSPQYRGKVVRLNVPMGETVKPNQVIVIMVGSGDNSVYLPAVEGLSEEEATEKLLESGFDVTTRTVDAPQPAGTVVGTDPSDRVPRGSTVTLLISNGQHLSMPNVRGLRRDEALSQLRKAGWKGHANIVAVGTTNLTKAGSVADQDPAPGTPLSKDQTITLKVYQIGF